MKIGRIQGKFEIRQEQVNFVISGGGGMELRPPQPTSRSLFAKELHRFTILEANPTELDIRLVGTDAN